MPVGRGDGVKSTHTINRAVPPFKYERAYPIGYFTSRDPRMLF